MTTQGNETALLSTDRQPATTETATTEAAATETTETKETTPGADDATGDDKSTTAASDETAGTETETVEAETGEDQDQPEGAPETYQFEAPEGTELRPEGVAAFETIARKLDLNNGEAQELVNAFGSELVAIATAQQEAWDQESNVDWVEAVRTDELVGGTEEQLAQNLGVAKRALDKFGDKGMDELMTRFRLGNHPAFVRFCHRAGLTLQEETSIPRAGQTSDQRLPDSAVFYT